MTDSRATDETSDGRQDDTPSARAEVRLGGDGHDSSDDHQDDTSPAPWERWFMHGRPPGKVTWVARYVWPLLVITMFAAIPLSFLYGTFDNPASVVLVGLMALLLLFQAGFLLRYPELAADRGVFFPKQHSSTLVTSVDGVYWAAMADIVLAAALVFLPLK